MSAEDPGSITRWLEGLKAGRPEAFEAIWDRFYARVLQVARRRLLRGPHQAVEDGEDVALERHARPLRGFGPGAVRQPWRSFRPLAAPRRHHRSRKPSSGASGTPARNAPGDRRPPI